ncbi:MAG: transcription initiation factor IIB family protein [Halobacteriales archaeon]
MNATRTCPECDGRIRPDGDEELCTDCGLVVSEDRLDRGPEWRPLDDGGERVGAPLTRARHDRGLSTEIGRGSSRLGGRKRRRLARLRRQHNRARIASKAERNRVYAFTEIRRITGARSLPDGTRDLACVLFERAQDADLLRGRSLEGFAAAAVYAACRIGSLARTRTEIGEVARASLDELDAAYAAMNRDLDLPTGPVDPAEYLPRFASDLGLPSDIEARAGDLLEELRDDGHLAGRNPGGVAAACLYAAATERDYPLTQSEAASVADVSAVTVRSNWEALAN